MIEWEYINAAAWRAQKKQLHPLKVTDPIQLIDLIGIDRQKQQVIENTQQFLAGNKANHVLLWGSRGAGKSSLIKALLNEYKSQGLRLIEVDRDALFSLPEIIDDIRDLEHKFIIYCDDLTFEAGETSYRGLKSVLEGSIEAPPQNVLVYATSNRRHLVPEYMHENIQTTEIDDIHYRDTVEEKLALADRFGLWIGFYPIEQKTYLSMVDFYCKPLKIPQNELHESAKQFAMQRGCMSGRTAKQFYLSMQLQNN